MIIMEVIPFLVLAVGVDNLFILVATADRSSPPHAAAPAERAASALAAAGPSMLLAAAAEAVGFAVGTMTSMPALSCFAATASIALIVNFALQITALPALVALDRTRALQRRYDVAPWIKSTEPWTEDEDDTFRGSDPGDHHAEEQGSVSEIEPETVPASINHTLANPSLEYNEDTRAGIVPALRWYMRHVHAPILRHPWVKGAVVSIFLGMFLLSCAMLPRLQK